MNRGTIVALAALIFASLSQPAAAFFEENIEHGGKPVSTVHYHLVRALSRCVGFDATESNTIAAWSQLMDSGELDDPELGHLEQSFGTRTSPNYRLFHWPLEADLTNMRLWVTGKAPLFECATKNCDRIRPVDTGLESGSMEAFGVYLHGVADHYSHSECLDTGNTMHSDKVEACELDNHFEEFGTEALDHTFEGIRAIHRELIWWAAYNESYSGVLPTVIEESVQRFVTRASYWRPGERAEIADELYRRCDKEQRQLRPR